MDGSCLIVVFFKFSQVPVTTELNPIIHKEIVQKCAHRMGDVGTYLKIEPHKVSIIEADHRGAMNQFMAMITAWSHKDNGTGPVDRPRTAQLLYDAVTDAGFPVEAEAFKAKVAEMKNGDIN